MNRRTVFLSFVLVSVLMTSIITSDLTKGIIVSDQLEISAGAYTEGKVLYTNSTLTDYLIAYATIKADRIFTPTDISAKLIQFTLDLYDKDKIYTLVGYFENENHVKLSTYVFYDNRTTLMMPRFFMGNDTYSVEISVLDQTTFAGMQNVNNTKITYNNGTSYIFGNVLLTDAIYPEISFYVGLMSGFSGYYASAIYQWTLFGISPTANLGDNVNAYNTLGDVISKPAVTTTNDKSYDSILVRYYDNFMFGFDSADVDIYYEAASGFPLRVVETFPSSVVVEFVPGEFKSSSGIPFSSIGVVLGLGAIGLIVYLLRRRK